MVDNTDLKAEIIKLTNAYYAGKGIKKTVSEENWTKITEPCSSEEASDAAIDVCAKYGIRVPSDAKALIAKGLDAVATYISDRSFIDGGINPLMTKSVSD